MAGLVAQETATEAPLWDLHLKTRLMHDLGSLTLEFAILRHKHEAAHVTRAFSTATDHVFEVTVGHATEWQLSAATQDFDSTVNPVPWLSRVEGCAQPQALPYIYCAFDGKPSIRTS